MGTAYLSDPVLLALDAEQIPTAFIVLPDAEQRWRGRLFMALYWLTHHPAFSWAHALITSEPEQSEWRKMVTDADDDDLILARFRAANAEVAIEQGADLGATM